MGNRRESTEFNLGNAKLLDAISHPLRVKILEALRERPMELAELGEAASIVDKGQLSFHLSKLGDLVTTLPDGRYALTGDGKEAMWTIQSLREDRREGDSNAT